MNLRLNPAYAVFAAAILIASWPDGTTTHDPATTMPICMDAAEAYISGRGNYPGHQNQRARSATCVPADPLAAGFKPGWDVIKGYNDR